MVVPLAASANAQHARRTRDRGVYYVKNQRTYRRLRPLRINHNYRWARRTRDTQTGSGGRFPPNPPPESSAMSDGDSDRTTVCFRVALNETLKNILLRKLYGLLGEVHPRGKTVLDTFALGVRKMLIFQIRVNSSLKHSISLTRPTDAEAVCRHGLLNYIVCVTNATPGQAIMIDEYVTQVCDASRLHSVCTYSSQHLCFS